MRTLYPMDNSYHISFYKNKCYSLHSISNYFRIISLSVIIIGGQSLTAAATLFTDTIINIQKSEAIPIQESRKATVEIMDTTSDIQINYRFKPNQLILPVALMSFGIVGMYSFDDFNSSIRDNLSGYKKGHTFKADEFIQYATAIGYVGLGFIPNIKRRSDLRERLMAGVSAYAIMAIAVNTMKYTFKHPRPGSGTRNSFPSGHSATAFTGAELMRIEYGNRIGLAGYAVAMTVGALRIYNDRHWFTDVIGGAAIGILSARIGYWLIPLEHKLFHLDKNKATNNLLAVLPMIGDTNGINLSLTF